MQHRLSTLTAIGLLVVATTTASAQAGERLRVMGAQGTGFVAAGGSADGAAYLRGRSVSVSVSGDGSGNATLRSGGVYRGPGGGTAARSGQTSRSADGTLSHQSGFAAQGAGGGSVQSSGGLTRSADGVNQSSTTTATAANGNTYSGSTSYDPQSGLSHTATCTDAAGQVIACR